MQLCRDRHVLEFSSSLYLVLQHKTCHNFKNVLDAVDVCQVEIVEWLTQKPTYIGLISRTCFLSL